MRSGLPQRDASRGQIDYSLATVNIVLLLVFFFLITGTLVESDEQAVDLAETQDLPLDRLPRPLLLMVAEDEWVLDGTPVTAETLPVAFEEAVAELNLEVPVLNLLPDKDLPAQALVSLLQRTDLNGAAIRLVTLRLNAGEEP